MNQRSLAIIRYGSNHPLPDRMSLRAGPLSLICENGDLRTIKLGDRELVRRIYVAVRDHNWDTIPAALSAIQIQRDSDRFAIAYTATHRRDDIHFVWRADIRGEADGTISFQMAGEALSTFRRNRIGFCVLHPMRCAGDRARIQRTDGSVEESVFPVQIAPQLSMDGTIHPVYPFADMRALTHVVEPGVSAKVTFAGDVFEMEDQRNWTDASYKTYSTPLALPFPVEIAAGTQIEQAVVVTVQGQVNARSKIEDPLADDPVSVVVDGQTANPLPAIGLGIASHGQGLREQEIERLRALHLSHLRVDLDLADQGYAAQLRAATMQAHALGVALEVALFVGEDAGAQLAALRRHLDEVEPPVCRWLVFQTGESVTPDGLVALAKRHLAACAPDARFGGGSNAYFTDVNRQRPTMDDLDFLAYSLNPQVHAFDNVSVMETVEAQAATVESAHRLADGKDVVVSPVTLLPRFNPNATGPAPTSAPDALPPQVDVRQMSLFGAAWTVGSLKHLLGSGVDAVTYFETAGWRGLMEVETGSPLPAQFPSTPGMVFPLYHVFADVGEGSMPSAVAGAGEAGQGKVSSRAEARSADVLHVITSDALRVDGLALRRNDDVTLLLANLTPWVQQVEIEGLGSPAHIRRLDESTFEQAVSHPEAFRNQRESLTSAGRLVCALAPYGVVRIDANVGKR